MKLYRDISVLSPQLKDQQVMEEKFKVSEVPKAYKNTLTIL